MSNADRIEELRTKYEENPRRYFAPLANEYRKAGDLALAISICREHLPKQPGHMSGYIVYGQTLFEANNLEEARTVFEQALSLDPENLIALKHLGDIARMNGENGVARRWYARVLDADPRNDDIASQLASLGAPTPAAPVPVIAEPAHPAQPYSGNEAVGVFATFDPGALLDVPEDVVGISGNREFWTPAPEPRAVPHHEPLDLDFPESPEPVAEEDFEEGILAPEWPDTSELVARVVTPFHSQTPISVPATPDTLAAFGRESFDQVETTPVDPAPADELVDAFLPPEPAARAMATEEPLEFTTSEFEINSFEPTEFDAPTVDTPMVATSDVIRADVELRAESVLEQHDVQFIDEPSSSSVGSDAGIVAATVDNGADDDAFEDAFSVADVAEEVVANEVGTNDVTAEVTALADEDVVWADSVVPTSTEPELAIAETFQAEPFELETTLSQAQQSIVEQARVDEPNSEASSEFALSESDELHGGVTAEFEVPEQFKSGVHATFAAPEPSFDEATFEAEVLQEPLVDDVIDEPIVPVVAATVPEESFAEISSQIESEKAAPFVTETMAELLVAQGFLPRAIEVYDELVRRRPHDPVLASRLTELRTLHEAEQMPEVGSSVSETFASDPTPRFNTPVRNTPLYMTPQFNTPHFTTPLAATPLSSTPLSATPVLVPAVGESNTTQSNLSERHTNERLQAFRTARERFAELSRRRVARRTPTHATALGDDAVEGLSSLFGTAVPTTTDELAARALADAFGPVQDSGESLFDPAPTPTPASPMRSLTPRSTTPVYTPAMPDSRADKQSSDRQPAADYSFDRFFPDPAMAGREGQSAQTSTSSATSSQPANEDLAQFSAWLKGLNNA